MFTFFLGGRAERELVARFLMVLARIIIIQRLPSGTILESELPKRGYQPGRLKMSVVEHTVYLAFI